MNGKAGALGYLILRTTRNRIAKQASRLRNPRYVFALLFGIGYLYLTFFRRAAAMPASTGSFITAMHGAALTFLAFLTVAITWLFGRTSGALAFLPAEVHYLFPGPLSRRQLLVYRMVRSQLVLLLNALIWTLLLRRFGLTLSAPMRFFAAWAGFSVLSLHQLGTALVLAPPARGARRIAGWVARGLAAAGVVALLVGVAPLYLKRGELDITSAMELLGQAVASPPISTVLAPFHLIVAPLLATSVGGWLAALAAVIGIIALHVVWILSMHVEFADLAVTASAKRAERLATMRAARSGGAIVKPRIGKSTRQWLPLAPVGHPAIAIAWKNTMSLIRGMGTRTIVMIVALVVPFVVMSRTMGASGGGEDKLVGVIPYLMILAITLLTGPRMLRNDLRQDLLRLSTLKTFPMTGSALVAGEILSPTLVLTALQSLVVALCYLTVPAVPAAMRDAGVPMAVLVLVPFAFLAWNGVNTIIQNGLTLMFPSWVRLGSDSGGVEAMGQNLLVTFGSMFALLLSLLLPVGAAVAMVVFTRLAIGSSALAPSIAAGTVVGILLLLGEIVAMVGIFGRTFDRMDPTSIS